jgi:hypothetical protein
MIVMTEFERLYSIIFFYINGSRVISKRITYNIIFYNNQVY